MPAFAAPPADPGYRIIRRNGSVTPFDPTRIVVALTKAFLAVEGQSAAASRRVHETVAELTDQIVAILTRRVDAGSSFHIEDVQDQVELALMRGGHHKVARAYVRHREERARERAKAGAAGVTIEAETTALRMTAADGSQMPLNTERLAAVVAEACAGLDGVAPDAIMKETQRNLYDGITQDELALALIMAVGTQVESEPNYTFASARLLLDKLRREALSHVFAREEQATQSEMTERYAEYFPEFIRTGIDAELIDPELTRFDLGRIAAALKPKRDFNFQYFGLQTLYDCYFLHEHGTRFGCARRCRYGSQRTPRLGRSARACDKHRHAQFQQHGDRADGDDLEYLWRIAIHRARLSEPLRQIEHVRRFHRGEFGAGPRPEGKRALGRSDGI
jgi:ribonucleoside-diphosphate reductase alpha chain